MNEILALFLTPGFGEIALVLVFIFQIVLLLELLIWSRWHWMVKAITTVMAGVIFSLTYFAILNMQGWPTSDVPAERFELISFYVANPNPNIGKEGFITVWILDLEDTSAEKRPRAHIFEYNKKLHRQLQLAMQQGTETGNPVTGAIRRRKGDRPPVDSTLDDLQFYDLPIPKLPSK